MRPLVHNFSIGCKRAARSSSLGDPLTTNVRLTAWDPLYCDPHSSLGLTHHSPRRAVTNLAFLNYPTMPFKMLLQVRRIF